MDVTSSGMTIGATSTQETPPSVPATTFAVPRAQGDDVRLLARRFAADRCGYPKHTRRRRLTPRELFEGVVRLDRDGRSGTEWRGQR
jgi:hypothetical protein